MDHLLLIQPNQLACRRRGSEDSEAGSAVPTTVVVGGQTETAGHVQPQGGGQHQLLSGDTADRLSNSQTRSKDRRSRMHVAAFVIGVVKIQGVPHGRVDHCCMMGRHLATDYRQAGFL